MNNGNIDIKTGFVDFDVRESRPGYVVDEFEEIFGGTVLDLGSDAGVIKNRVGSENVLGVDVSGSADMVLDFDTKEPLPFPDRQFDTVVCLDVLEHLENLHHVFEEAVRVTGKWLLISLPNAWHLARVRIARGRGRISHYGLETEPPLDRHRWFFSFEEARDYFLAAQSGDLRIIRMVSAEKPVPPFLRLVRRAVWGSRNRYSNRYSHTLFCLFKKV